MVSLLPNIVYKCLKPIFALNLDLHRKIKTI